METLTHGILSILCLVSSGAMAAEKPNIVLLISDDDHYQHFGFMGSEVAYTPTLNRITENGTVFRPSIVRLNYVYMDARA